MREMFRFIFLVFVWSKRFFWISLMGNCLHLKRTKRWHNIDLTILPFANNTTRNLLKILLFLYTYVQVYIYVIMYICIHIQIYHHHDVYILSRYIFGNVPKDLPVVSFNFPLTAFNLKVNTNKLRGKFTFI